jgi:hypothetical protein
LALGFKTNAGQQLAGDVMRELIPLVDLLMAKRRRFRLVGVTALNQLNRHRPNMADRHRSSVQR